MSCVFIYVVKHVPVIPSMNFIMDFITHFCKKKLVHSRTKHESYQYFRKACSCHTEYEFHYGF